MPGLFDDDVPAPRDPEATRPAAPAATRASARPRPGVLAAAACAEHADLARRLPPALRLGTSSWSFPGWTGLIWAEDYAETRLARQGLRAYAEHALMRCVSLDRAFYTPLERAQYAAYAAQVPEDFRFVVKAPSLIADALVREEGRALAPNSAFLDPELAVSRFAEPALDGLGTRLGALVFQLSPLPPSWLADPAALLQRLETLLRALPELRTRAPDAVVAVEFRDPLFARLPWRGVLVDLLRRCGATYCLSLHGKMPPIDEQLPILRALWPGPLVCRWNLHRRHGAFGYEEARRLYGAFDRLVDPDPDTRRTLARVAAATAQAGFPAYVTIGNKAEGSAPASVIELARELASR